MLHLILVALVFGGTGFGLGRVKNAKKLAAVSTALSSAEASASADALKVITAVRSKL